MPYADKNVRRAYIKEYKRLHRDRMLARRRELWRIKSEARKLNQPPRLRLSESELKRRKSEQDRRYRLSNHDSLREKKHLYYVNNKKLIQQRFRAKYYSDINLRLSANIRSRIQSAIRGSYKAGSAVRDLGCSIDNFRRYIENMFEPGMSWEKRREWHLDHIIPLCDFDLTDREQFLKACHYTNYRPLWAPDNLRKNRYADYRS
jgi:hypothetical protein